MAPTKKKMFPRGGQLVSSSQKKSKLMQKVKKQQGKKPDLFSEKRVFKESITKELKEKFKGHKKAKVDAEMPQVVRENLADVDMDAKDEDDLPKFPVNITPKIVQKETLALVAIRTVDQYGIACSFPGGNTAYIQAINISEHVAQSVDQTHRNKAGRGGKPAGVDLQAMYAPGDLITVWVTENLRSL